ncbi:hypothetical protein AWB67_06435 [Caballeronia terrestris]|uniref:Uncharacterized protein n=1 Tax=Caballeronia terrestris TaxID=1226301 RepID=A0A158KRA6_9BURK|nr:hypothetical protein AWB67_06435 [Caballeronia terrestris]
MYWITLIGTVVFSGVVGISLLALFDVLFSKPHYGRVDVHRRRSPDVGRRQRVIDE